MACVAGSATERTALASADPHRQVTKLGLTHPDLDFWVDVAVHERNGRFKATADLGKDSRDVVVGDMPQEAVRAALRSLGEPYASEMAESLTG